MVKDKITDKRLENEFKRIETALKRIKIIIDEKNSLYKKALECLDMAKRYYEDAKYFKKNDDYASAFGALNYAFGLLDAGIKLGVFSDHGLY